MTEPNHTDYGRTVTVRIPISIRKRGGRKLIIAPDGKTETPGTPSRRIDNAMVKAIARAFRWREILEGGKHTTIREIASAEQINESYVGRVLRLTLLAPNLVDAILNGKQPEAVSLETLMQPIPILWRGQVARVGGAHS